MVGCCSGDGIGGRLVAGEGVTVTGAGTVANPYVVSAAALPLAATPGQVLTWQCGTFARRNLYTNPEFVVAAGVEITTTTATLSYGSVSPIGTAATVTRTATGAVRMGLRSVTLAAASPYTTGLVLLSSVDASVTVNLRPNTTSGTNSVQIGSVSLIGGVPQVVTRQGGTANATHTAGTAGIALIWATGAVGATLSVTDVLVEAGSTGGGFFDGATPDTATNIYSWDGDENASTSRLDTCGWVAADAA